MQASVSVIVPAHNAGQWIGETLSSILAQTMVPLQVIVIDDGSTDNTADVVRSFGTGVQYAYQANAGAGAARNLGLTFALGEYVAFLDADDLWLPEKIEKQLLLFKNQPDLMWVYSDAYIFPDGRPDALTRLGQYRGLPSGWIHEALLLGDCIASPTPLVRRCVFSDVGPFLVKPALGVEDWDMWLRISRRYPVGVIPEPLAKYRLRRSSVSHSVSPMLRFHAAMLVVDLALKDSVMSQGGLADRAHHNVCLSEFERAIALNSLDAARRIAGEALRYRITIRALLYAAIAYCPAVSVNVLLRMRRKWRGTSFLS
jgi:hypothetical protein